MIKYNRYRKNGRGENNGGIIVVSNDSTTMTTISLRSWCTFWRQMVTIGVHYDNHHGYHLSSPEMIFLLWRQTVSQSELFDKLIDVFVTK